MILGDPKDTRSYNDHSIILWLNIPTAGVLSAAKNDWMITTVSNILAQYRRNGLAVIVHCNRAGEGGRTLMTNLSVSRCL